MTTIVTRTGKGSPLTHVEVDTNFTNLNTAKLETAAIPLGTAAAPSVSFLSDANTGIFSPSADQLAVATNGVERVEFGNTEVVFNDGGANYDFRIEGDAVDNLFFVDASADKIGIGSITALGPKLNIYESGTGMINALHLGSGGGTAGNGASISFGLNNSFDPTANILAKIGGIYTGGGYEGALTFHTNTGANGTSPTERLRVTSAGLVGIGTSSPSTRFNIAAGDSNLSTGFLQDGATTGYNLIQIKNTSGYTLIGVNGTTVGLAASSALANSTVVGTNNNTVLHLITNGGVRATVDTAGLVGIGDTAPDSTLTIKAASSTTPLRISGPSSEFARVDSSGRLLVGTSTSGTSLLQVNAQASASGNAFRSNHRIADSGTGITQTTQAAPYISYCYGFNANTNVTAIAINGEDFASQGLQLELNNLKGSGAVTNGERFGRIAFGGDDGTNIIAGALIDAFVDGTPGANDMPGRLVFSTTADGASSPTEAMRINSQQELLVGTATRTANGGKLQLSSGITFPATAVAATDANTLDDYEEGSITGMTVTGATSGSMVTTALVGKYIKIGDLVTVNIYLRQNTTTAVGTYFIINGALPFTPATNPFYLYTAAFSNYNSAVSIPAQLLGGGNSIYVYTDPALISNGQEMAASATYKINNP